jgi:thiol-disulfide isomerase/thioredoxin
MPRVLLLAAIAASLGCATTSASRSASNSVATDAASGEPTLCTHQVPGDSCVRCHPELTERFKRQGDWCPEHEVPETQCLLCHPDMKFAALPTLPDSADLKFLSTMGEDVPELASHAVRGKVTVFDFYAPWCVACRDVDVQLYTMLAEGRNLAVRKLNVMSWETPLAARYVSKVPALPYVVVYGVDGKAVGAISGLKLQELESLIVQGSR